MSNGNDMPVCIRGETYPSVNAATEAFGLKRGSISSYLHRYGHLDGVGLGYASPERNKTPRNKTPVTIHGAEFPTIQAVADALGVNYQGLVRTLNRPMTPKKSDRLLQLVIAWMGRFEPPPVVDPSTVRAFARPSAAQ
ncbi:hypothetical protein [Paracoccus marcusii]|uniref:hypothetical protein n=1 Tax=Paracoccus marcusii TaxID=59779 RepID=UPI002492927E|nr:hypothetical protein [Paracoccus marcusii]